MTFTVCFKHEKYAEYENQDQICDCALMSNKYPSKRKSEIPDHFEKVQTE